MSHLVIVGDGPEAGAFVEAPVDPALQPGRGVTVVAAPRLTQLSAHAGQRTVEFVDGLAGDEHVQRVIGRSRVAVGFCAGGGVPTALIVLAKRLE